MVRKPTSAITQENIHESIIQLIEKILEQPGSVFSEGVPSVWDCHFVIRITFPVTLFLTWFVSMLTRSA
jgi:hypothetical protein